MKRSPILLLLILLIAFSAQAQKHRKIKIKTDYGKMVLKLSDETPLHRDNFIKLVKRHFYDGLLFHRVIKNFMIQGGDPDSKNAKSGTLLGNGNVGYTIPPEFRQDLFHRKGALAMARDNNPQKASSGCQFYIVDGKTYSDAELDQVEARTGRKISPQQREVYKTIGGTPWLDQNYTIFGQLVKGMNVLDKIVSVPVDENNRPIKDVHMKIRLVKKFLFF